MSLQSWLRLDACYSLSKSISGQSSWEISPRMNSILSDLETKTHEVPFAQFVASAFGINARKAEMIMTTRWVPNPNAFNECYMVLHSSAGDYKIAFERFVITMAKDLCGIFGEDTDAQKLEHYLSFTYCFRDSPDTLSLPPLSMRSCQPITSADTHYLTSAIEVMRYPGIHYAMYTLVDRYSISLRYYDRSGIFRTNSIKFLEDQNLFYLFAYGIGHRNDRINFSQMQERPSRAPPLDLRRMAPWIGLPSTILPPYRLSHVISYEDHSLIGRGSMVCQVITPDGRTKRPLQVLKLSWQSAFSSQLNEAEIVEKLLQVIPSWDAHLPDIKDRSIYTAAQLGLPRAELLKLLPADHAYEDKRLHAFITPRYQHLWEVDNIKEFEDVFVDCVECHYRAYVEGKFLHRDLNDNNLMFQRYQKWHFAIAGIVNDWDMACPVDNNNYLSVDYAYRRTGSTTFMTCELRDESALPPLYRHDLESFFYILVWAAVHCDLKRKQKRPTDPALMDWTDPEPRRSQAAKLLFLTEDKCSSEIFSKVAEEFEGVLETWIKPLRRLFKDAIQSSRPFGQVYDLPTLGGQITFDTFMRVLGREPHELGKHRP